MNKGAKILGNGKNRELRERGSRPNSSHRSMPTKQIIIRLLQYLGRARFFLYAIFAMLVISTLLTAAKPLILGKIIDNLTALYYNPEHGTDVLFYLLALLVLTTTLAGIIQYLQGYFSAHFSKKIIFNLRSDIYNALVYLPLSYLESHKHGDLMSRVANDSENVTSVISQSIASFFSSIISIVTITVIMLSISPLLTAVIYFFVPLSVYITKRLSAKLRYYFRLKHESLGNLEGNIEENIYGYETLLAYNQRERVLDKFSNVNEEYKNISIKSFILSSLINPLLMILSGLTYLIILFLGAYLAINGKISLGTIQTFLLYIRQVTQPLNSITSLYSQIQTAFASAERIFEILDAQKEEDKGHIQNVRLHGNFSIENVSFGYNEKEEILKDFELEIKAGQKIGIVGETGSGKTSLINMLMRFYPYSKGNIVLDGEKLEDYSLETLRKNIALVPQETFFYSDSIKNNLLYASDKEKYSQEELENKLVEAAKSANAHDFIMQLQNQYESALTTEASNISMGQRQLLALTRAFIKDAPILILDEATANIDTLTEMKIQDAILSLMENRTCLVIAHRLSTVINMDKIIVLEQGKIVEFGSHSELMEKQGKYYSLYMYSVEEI